LRAIDSFEQIESWIPGSVRHPVPVRQESEASDAPAFVLVCPEGAMDPIRRQPLVFPPNTRFVESSAPAPDARSLAERIAETLPTTRDAAVAFYDPQLSYSSEHFIRASDAFGRTAPSYRTQ
jgi:hypothetical protein